MTAVIEESILELLKDDSKFSARIKQFTDGRTAYEKAKAAAAEAEASLAKKKTETDSYVNGKKAELSAKQQEHDKAAAEAAARIKANHDQMAEVQRVLAEVNAKKSDLDGRERDMARREKILQETVDSIGARQQALDKATDLIRRQQAHIAAMPRQ